MCASADTTQNMTYCRGQLKMDDLLTPYVSQNLFLPKAFVDEFLEALVSRKDDGIEPFARQIDLWWTALMIGVALDKRTTMPEQDQLSKLGTGHIFARDQWRIVNLELIVLAKEGEEVCATPSKVLAIGHEYMMTGLEWMAEKLRAHSNPTLKLMTEIESILPQP